MRFFDIIGFALMSLGSNRVRTLLMLLAMSIGVAAVVLLTGIGNGARLYIVDQFSSLGTNLVIVIPGRAETASNTPATLIGETPRDLTLNDAKALERGDTVRRLAPLNIGEMNIAWRGKERQVPLLGSTAPLLPLHHLKMERGSFLPDEDMEIARPVCVIGAKVYRELFGQQNALGELVNLGGFRCRVIGILGSQGRSLGFDTEELVIVPVAFAQALLNTEGLFRILLEAKDLGAIDRLKTHIKTTIAKRHYGEEDVTVITQDSVLATFDKILKVLTLTVAGIAGISLVVAGILIMNVMLMAVAQRTAEIGLCKALGAGQLQIMALLVAEALLLSSIGGLLGLGLGFAGSWITVQFYPTLQTTPPPWAIAAALGTALTTGFVFSLLPARRAARLDPIEALARH
ncbi:ABC transporter permease [uncultured Desulfobulbus sp.]|uniref:ABC transporter permease n=1 Tax=uncultured Desulfobulbus sp. TaxID=239745 RepID=UPI0029C7AFBF|nr:ABC transporter permease [uncultured Desulfobulbus sp.]